MFPEGLELLVPHVVDGEDEEPVVLVDGLTDLVDQLLLEVEAHLLGDFAQGHFAISLRLGHLQASNKRV